MEKGFFNTVNLKGEKLKESWKAALTQQERVLFILKANKKGMTPSDVHKIYCHYWNTCPITSIRRAMSNLTENGDLEKTQNQAEGIYGKPNYIWKYIVSEPIQGDLFKNFVPPSKYNPTKPIEKWKIATH